MIDSKHEMAAPREETLTLWEWAWRRCKETQPHPPCLPGPTKEKPQQHNQTLHHKKKATNYQPKLQQACTCKLTVPSTVMRTSPWEIGWDNSTTILPCTSSCKKRTHTKRSKLWDLFGTKLSEKAQNLKQDRTADSKRREESTDGRYMRLDRWSLISIDIGDSKIGDGQVSSPAARDRFLAGTSLRPSVN